MSEPKDWTVTSPDGRQWHGESPLRACAAAQRDTIDPVVAMQRINALVDEENAIRDAELEAAREEGRAQARELLEAEVAALRTNGPPMRRGMNGDGTPWMGTMRDVLEDWRTAAKVEAEIRREARAQVKQLRATLRRAGQVIAWQCFGECRAYSADPVPEPAAIDAEIKAALEDEQAKPISGCADGHDDPMNCPGFQLTDETGVFRCGRCGYTASI